MVVRLGRYGKFLACSLYPEHKETRPLPGEEDALEGADAGSSGGLPGTGEICPKCGAEHGGHLVTKRGRFGPFLGCSRYPDCDYIQRTSEPVPQLAFEPTCPECGKGHLVARRARRRGTLFYGCSRYPNCRYTTEREPLGAVHGDDEGAVAAGPKGPICLKCGASVDVPEGAEPGTRVTGGPPDPAALQRPARGGRRGGRGGAGRRTRRTTTRRRTAKPA
jgi:ssDNA-binding Zn-finger/Zn-ribbon topoisomerase 1